MKRFLSITVYAVIAAYSVIAVNSYPYNPPAGGESAHTFFSPAMLGGQASVCGSVFGDTTPADMAVNPAVSAFEQRVVFDASGAMLVGFRNEKGVKGGFANLDFLYPSRWGVFAADAHFFHSAFITLPWGSAGSLRVSYAKDLTEKLSVGTGFFGIIGTGWGIGADIGVLYKFGDLGFAKNAKLGVSLTGMGKPYVAEGKSLLQGFPGMFTPRVGFSTTLFSAKYFKMGMNFDLSFPTLMNIVFDTGLHMMFADMVTFKTGWNFNVAETIRHKQTYIPSFALACSIKINSKDKSSPWEQSDITPQLAVKPFYNSIFAFAAGVNVRVGQKDTKPPVIMLNYPNPYCISPNNDGIQDTLEIPFSITDKRYIASWKCTIENEKGELVRTIENKRPFRHLDGFKSFWKLLGSPKKGIEVPPLLKWDGMLDSGGVAADGIYYFTVTATDDNDNTAATERYTVIVDNTPPSITVEPALGQDAFIFSPDGDGNKDSFHIKQNGSKEALWTATVLNAKNQAVYTVKIKNDAPGDFIWDGKNTAGVFVADGVYRYHIAAKDRAGNTVAKTIANIIVDTVKPSVALTISSNAFSPNDDGIKDAILLSPDIPVKNGLVSWQIDIVNAGGSIVCSMTNTTIKPLVFDGKDESGNRLPEGIYHALLSARYTNGYQASEKSPVFVLDITAPVVTVASSTAIFSPDGDGMLDTVTFTQKGDSNTDWHAQIFRLNGLGSTDGKPVYSTEQAESGFVWSGRTNTGSVVADGTYGYRLTGTDEAGNTGISNFATVALNTEKADIILSADMFAFSPNGDAVQDTVTFSPSVKSNTTTDSYTFTIRKDGSPVKTITGKGKPPTAIVWDGTMLDEQNQRIPCVDGIYSADITIVLANGQSAQSAIPEVLIDTGYPDIMVSMPYTIFSLDNEAKRHVLPVRQTSSTEKLWEASFIASNNTTVRSYTWQGNAVSFERDGTDNSGNKVPDGVYRYVISAEDTAGNKTARIIKNIVIDSRVPKGYITAELPAFSPNGSGTKDVQKLKVYANITDGLAAWTIDITPQGIADTKPVKTWSSAKESRLPETLIWDGTSDAGSIIAGTFTAVMSLQYKKGDTLVVSSTPFTSTVTPPQLDVTLTPRYFSPDNDGNEDELFINLVVKTTVNVKSWAFEIREPEETGNKLFWSTTGKEKIADMLVWDGRSLKGETVQSAMDYPFTFTVKDEVGMTGVFKGYIPIDVLVIRDGDKLKIAVPSIIFRKNGADFDGLEQHVFDKNVKVLTRIAEILNKFPGYKIQVEGHANNVSGTQREEQEDLIPLSSSRANSVREFLITKGVSRSRLTAVGIGGTQPIAPLSDKDNWWKNRRVEFILIK